MCHLLILGSDRAASINNTSLLVIETELIIKFKYVQPILLLFSSRSSKFNWPFLSLCLHLKYYVQNGWQLVPVLIVNSFHFISLLRSMKKLKGTLHDSEMRMRVFAVRTKGREKANKIKVRLFFFSPDLLCNTSSLHPDCSSHWGETFINV